MATTAQQMLANVDRLVLKSFAAGAKNYVSKYQDVFNIEKPERKDEKFTITKSDATFGKVADGAAFPEKQITELGTNTITTEVYKSAIPISDLADAFDNYGAIAEAASRQAYQALYAIDKLCADYANNASSSTSPYGFTISGTATSLISDTQPIGDTGTTFDNKISGALDKTTLNNAYIKMLTTPAHDGVIGGYQVRRLVIGASEAMNAWQITQSPEEPETANRNLNFTNTLGIQRIVWPLFDLTATGKALVLADKGDNGARGLRLEMTEMPTIRRILSQATGNWVYQVRALFNAGFIDWLGVVGINY